MHQAAPKTDKYWCRSFFQLQRIGQFPIGEKGVQRQKNPHAPHMAIGQGVSKVRIRKVFGVSAGIERAPAQIDGVREIHPDVRVAGCLITQWHKVDVVEDATNYLREESPVPVFDTVIRRTDKVLESTWAKQHVLLWSPYSSAAKDYRTWVRELMVKEALVNGR